MGYNYQKILDAILDIRLEYFNNQEELSRIPVIPLLERKLKQRNIFANKKFSIPLNLDYLNFYYVHFINVTINDSTFKFADLVGARFVNVTATNVNFTNAKNLTDDVLRDAENLDRSFALDDFNPPIIAKAVYEINKRKLESKNEESGRAIKRIKNKAKMILNYAKRNEDPASNKNTRISSDSGVGGSVPSSLNSQDEVASELSANINAAAVENDVFLFETDTKKPSQKFFQGGASMFTLFDRSRSEDNNEEEIQENIEQLKKLLDAAEDAIKKANAINIVDKDAPIYSDYWQREYEAFLRNLEISRVSTYKLISKISATASTWIALKRRVKRMHDDLFDFLRKVDNSSASVEHHCDRDTIHEALSAIKNVIELQKKLTGDLSEEIPVNIISDGDFKSMLQNIAILMQSYQPSCFISYAWGRKNEQDFVKKLATDLEVAGIQLGYDIKSNLALASSIPGFVAREIQNCTYTIVVGSPHYLFKAQEKEDSIVRVETGPIFFKYKHSPNHIIQLWYEGKSPIDAFPSQLGLDTNVIADMRQASAYQSQIVRILEKLYELELNRSAEVEKKQKFYEILSVMDNQSINTTSFQPHI